jgi:hypothetical protein
MQDVDCGVLYLCERTYVERMGRTENSRALTRKRALRRKLSTGRATEQTWRYGRMRGALH